MAVEQGGTETSINTSLPSLLFSSLSGWIFFLAMEPFSGLDKSSPGNMHDFSEMDVDAGHLSSTGLDQETPVPLTPLMTVRVLGPSFALKLLVLQELDFKKF